MYSKIRTLCLAAVIGICTACGPAAAAPPSEVVASPAAISPLPTYTPYPTLTYYPTPNLAGLFCEYEFCIGHPADVVLFDLEVVNQVVTNHSSYAQGNLLGFNGFFYVFIVWTQLAGEFDPAVMIDFTLRGDRTHGTVFSESMGGRTVSYALLASTASPAVLPYGLAAAWQCGDRVFGWKVYVSQDGQGQAYLHQALERFACK
jgi:hypothetical protein